MKQKKIRLLSLALVAALGLTATACNKAPEKTTKEEPKKTESKEDTEKTTDKDAETTTEGEQGGETEGKLERDPITITVFYESGEVPTNTNKLSALLKEELGVTLDAEFLVGDLDERMGLMVASGEYPDLMPFSQIVVDNGGARELDDILPKYENLDNHYSKYYGMMASADDGKMYYMPNYGVVHGDEIITEHWGTGNFIQKAVLEWAEYPEIKTMDEFFDVIERYKEAHPEIDGAPTIGFTILNDSWRNFGLVNPPQFLAGYQNNGNSIVDAETEVASDPSTTDIAMKYYKKLNEINKKGLMDKEFASMNYDQYIQKLSNGNVLATMDQQWSMNAANIALRGAGKFDRTYVSIPLVYEEGIEEHYRDQTIVNLNNGFMLTTVDDEKVDRIMTFLNDITTEKWSKLFSWGVEGEDYEVNENGKFYRTEEQRREQEDSAWPLENKLNAFFGYAPKLEGTFSDGNVFGPGNDPDEFYDGLNEYDRGFIDNYGKKSWAEFYTLHGENPIWYPTWNITTPEGSPAAIAGQKASDTKVQMLPGVIQAEDFDKAWADFVAKYDEANYQIMIDHINEQIQWRKDNWGDEN